MTIRIEHAVGIEAPPAVTWAVVEDVEHWPEFTTATKSIVRRGAGAFGVGSEARVTLRGARGSIWRVRAYEAGGSFTWDTVVMPGLRMSAGHVVEPAAAGSKLTLTLDVDGPLARLFRRRADSSVASEVAGVKRTAEARAAAPRP